MSYHILRWDIRCHKQTRVGFYKVYMLYGDVSLSEDLLLDYFYITSKENVWFVLGSIPRFGNGCHMELHRLFQLC